MDETLFNDLVSALNEAIAHEKGDIKLRTTLVDISADISDEEIERNQMFYENFDRLPEPHKVKAINYVNDLLKTAAG